MWALCISAMLCFVVAAIVLPCMVLARMRTKIWAWMWAARIAETGFSQEDVVWIYSVPDSELPKGVTADSVIKWVGQVAERGRIVKLRNSKESC